MRPFQPRRVRRHDRARDARGLSVLELVAGVALVLVLTTLGAVTVREVRDRADGLAAVRHLAGRLAEARLSALQTGRAAGLLLIDRDGEIRVQQVRDGNGNGVRVEELRRGIDRTEGLAESLGARFPAAAFGVAIAGPDIDTGDMLTPATDPVRTGSSGLLVASPSGTASSGTLYVRTRRGRQFAVRVFGPTGRVRAYEYQPGDRTWTPR